MLLPLVVRIGNRSPKWQWLKDKEGKKPVKIEQRKVRGQEWKGRVTIILTTHYMEEAEALSDRIAIMKEGKLLVCDTAERIKERAGTQDFEQAFVRIVKGVQP